MEKFEYSKVLKSFFLEITNAVSRPIFEIEQYFIYPLRKNVFKKNVIFIAHAHVKRRVAEKTKRSPM